MLRHVLVALFTVFAVVTSNAEPAAPQSQHRGYTITTPGPMPTFVTPTPGGSTTVTTPGRSPTFITPR